MGLALAVEHQSGLGLGTLPAYDDHRDASRRTPQRGIPIDGVDQALTHQPISYWHQSTWNIGYYDANANANVFVGTVNGVAMTVIHPWSGAQYIAHLTIEELLAANVVHETKTAQAFRDRYLW